MAEQPVARQPVVGRSTAELSTAGRGVRVVLATHNAHKVGELRAVVVPLVPGLAHDEIVGAGDLGLPQPVEDGVTFAENALIKARAVAQATGCIAVADDSGIAVDVLGGAPGIFSARWAGRHGDDQANLDLLLDQVADVPDAHRGARFVCAAALVTPDGHEQVWLGEMLGRLAREPHGGGGFGYDPILIPDGHDVTSAELSADQKNAISHRGKAFAQLAPALAQVLRGGPAAS